MEHRTRRRGKLLLHLDCPLCALSIVSPLVVADGNVRVTTCIDLSCCSGISFGSAAVVHTRSVASGGMRVPDGWGSLRLASGRLARLAHLPPANFQLCQRGILRQADKGGNISICCEARCGDGCWQCRKAMAAGRYKSADLALHHCCPAALLNRSANCRGANDVGCFARSEREVVPSSVLPARLLRHAIPESSYAHNAGLARLFGRHL